jgi:hypothetical protein
VRTIQTRIGAVEVAEVKIRDRAAASDGERIRFTSVKLLASNHDNTYMMIDATIGTTRP